MKLFDKKLAANDSGKQSEANGGFVGIFGEEEQYNDFYDSVSVVFRIASFVILAVFLVYIVTSAFSSADQFSYDNLEYIVRNFALTLDENKDDNVYAINYNPDTCRSYSLFGRGLAICGNSGVSIYSGTGRLTCSETFGYKNPVMAASEKYALVFDYGNNGYTLYNSFTEVFSSELSEDIRGASIANNGFYALITSSDEYTSTVEVYSNDFSLVNRFSTQNYVIDTDISDDYVLTASAAPNDSYGYTTQLVYCGIGASEALATVSVENDFPIACRISSHGFMVICQNSTVFFNNEGKVAGNFTHPQSRLVDYAASGDCSALLFKEEGFDLSYRLIFIDSSGDILYSKTLDTTVFDVEIHENRSYVLTDGCIFVFDADSETAVEFPGGNSDCKLLAYGDNTLYVCTPTGAPLVKLFD